MIEALRQLGIGRRARSGGGDDPRGRLRRPDPGGRGRPVRGQQRHDGAVPHGHADARARARSGSTARRGCASGRSTICSTPCGNSAPTRRAKSGNGCPPVVVRADGLPGGRATVAGDISSQFLSGLLMAAPYAAAAGRTGGRRANWSRKPYVDMTLAVMAVVRRRGRRRGLDAIRRSRPLAALSRPAIRHRARRLGRQLLLRRRGDHRRRGDGRGPFAQQPARRRRLLRLPGADGLRGRVWTTSRSPSSAGRFTASTST